MEYSVSSKFNSEANCWDIKITGEVDIYNSNEFKQTLTDLCKEKELDLHIDCSDLTFMDSTGLGALVAVLKNVKEYEGSIKLTHLKQNLCKMLRITNLDKIFIVEGDANE